MFYAHIILAKKGPLARIWLAAHWDKKITKAHVFETNIEKSVEGIMQPKVKLALRTSGHLLLGVVRIYSRKAKYLLADCNEAFVKIKMAFRPGMVDLPEGHREANVNAITLPEVFHDFDTALPELNDIDIEAQFSVNQSRADEITMREDYGSLSLSLHDDGFGDIGFEGDAPDLMRGDLDSSINDQLFENENISNVNNVSTADGENITLNENDLSSSRLDGDGFGDEFGQPELFEDDLFGEPALEGSTDKVPNIQANIVDSDNEDHFDNNVASPASSCHSLSANKDDKPQNETSEVEKGLEKENENNLDQSTLLQNEDESFALAPVDASAYKGFTKSKRKRKLIVDEIKNISGEEMKAQLANTSDIVTTLDLAPPTKRLMYWKETGGVEKLFSLPSRSIPARALFINYQRHLISHFTQLEDFSSLGPSDLLAIENIQNENEVQTTVNKRGRKRKLDIPVIMQQEIIDNAAEITSQSLSVPDIMREQESSAALSRVSLEISSSNVHDSLIPANNRETIEKGGSPDHIFSMHDIHNIDQLTSLNDIPLTPGNFHQGIDTSDDFNNGDLTPGGLQHGQMTPHHTGIESIESLPHLPADQVSPMLNETENPEHAIGSDWNDYDFTPAIGIPNSSEEQMENETDEQFEERVLNKRAAQLFYVVKTRLIKQDCLCLSQLTFRNSRKQAAQKFYSLLVLKKFRALNMSQTAPYSDIVVTRGPLFENPKL